MNLVHRVCLYEEKGFKDVGVGNGLNYEGIEFYKITDKLPQSHGYARPQDMHKGAYLSGMGLEDMQEMWDEDVKPHVQQFYMKQTTKQTKGSD